MVKTPENSRKQHEVYLVVADQTEEFQLALRYVSLLARNNGAKVAILRVLPQSDFQHWGGVEAQIQSDQRDTEEELLWSAAQKVNELGGLIPAVYLEEGGRLEVIIEVLNRDLNIRKLILGAETKTSSPGPLVSYFTGKGLQSLRVPLTIIPGHLTSEMIDEMI